jgi:hypothetical protein
VRDREQVQQQVRVQQQALVLIQQIPLQDTSGQLPQTQAVGAEHCPEWLLHLWAFLILVVHHQEVELLPLWEEVAMME